MRYGATAKIRGEPPRPCTAVCCDTCGAIDIAPGPDSLPLDWAAALVVVDRAHMTTRVHDVCGRCPMPLHTLNSHQTPPRPRARTPHHA